MFLIFAAMNMWENKERRTARNALSPPHTAPRKYPQHPSNQRGRAVFEARLAGQYPLAASLQCCFGGDSCQHRHTEVRLTSIIKAHMAATRKCALSLSTKRVKIQAPQFLI